MKLRLSTGIMLTCTLLVVGDFLIPEGISSMASAQEAVDSLARSLLTAPEADRKKIVDEYITARSAEMESTTAIIAGSANQLQESQRIDANAVEWHAARLLGAARARDAVPVLVKLAAVRDSKFEPVSNEYNPHWRSFPFAVALADIGMPAVAPLLKQIESSTLSTTEFQVACVTLEAILGKELAKAALKQRAEQFPEVEKGDRLEAAMKLVDIGHFHWSALDAKDFRFE
jgi:hypothetical protein